MPYCCCCTIFVHVSASTVSSHVRSAQSEIQIWLSPQFVVGQQPSTEALSRGELLLHMCLCLSSKTCRFASALSAPPGWPRASANVRRWKISGQQQQLLLQRSRRQQLTQTTSHNSLQQAKAHTHRPLTPPPQPGSRPCWGQARLPLPLQQRTHRAYAQRHTPSHVKTSHAATRAASVGRSVTAMQGCQDLHQLAAGVGTGVPPPWPPCMMTSLSTSTPMATGRWKTTTLQVTSRARHTAGVRTWLPLGLMRPRLAVHNQGIAFVTSQCCCQCCMNPQTACLSQATGQQLGLVLTPYPQSTWATGH